MKTFEKTLITLFFLTIINSNAFGGPMVDIPAGPFTMGNDQDSQATKEGRLFLDAYSIDKYEIRNKEYKQVYPDHEFLSSRGRFPAVRITWQEAKEYCEKLGKRLPTEAEWEKAARGEKGQLYPWGNKRKRNPPKPFYSGLAPKGKRGSSLIDSSPYGVRDMAGSVWEWTADDYGDKKVIRGGLWNLHLDFEWSKTYERAFIPPEEKLSFLGFRCVLPKK